MKLRRSTDDRRTHRFLISLRVTLSTYGHKTSSFYFFKSQGQGRSLAGFTTEVPWSLPPSSITSPFLMCNEQQSETLNNTLNKLHTLWRLVSPEIVWIICHLNINLGTFFSCSESERIRVRKL